MMSLGNNVGKLIAAKGVSYSLLAEKIEADSVQAIWNLVARNSRQSKYAVGLAKYFRVPLERLLAEDFDVSEAPDLSPKGADGNQLSEQERQLVECYRVADPRWRLSLRLLAAIATSAQDEIAEAVNVVIAKIFAKHPSDLKYTPDARVHEVLGDAPHVHQSKARYK